MPRRKQKPGLFTTSPLEPTDFIGQVSISDPPEYPPNHIVQINLDFIERKKKELALAKRLEVLCESNPDADEIISLWNELYGD